MKNSILPLTIVIFVTSLIGLSFTTQTPIDHFLPQEETYQIDIPDNVQAILDRSCLPCHGADGTGKAKMKWNYEKMPEYSKTKLISKLVKISEKVEEEKMPPPKKLKKHPDWKLSDEDKNIIMKWTDDTAEQITSGTN